MDINIDNTKKIHMVGIGGVSMSGIADILVNLGYTVSGSDANESDITKRLEAQGIPVKIGHYPENVHGSDVVVYTAAVKQDNPELVEAHNLNIETIERSDFLGMLTKLYKETIAISGTHGKTTTTSMVSSIFLKAASDPTIQVGADLSVLDGLNYRVGKSDYFIVEACEYVRSFLKFFPKTAVVLNIEEEHLDCYKDLEDIKNAFNSFLDIPSEDGTIILNADDSDCMAIAENHKAKLITFGIDNTATWTATNISKEQDGTYSFTAKSNSEELKVKLSVFGYHNIYNALAAIAVAKSYTLPNDAIIEGLLAFGGAKRRFEYVGMYRGVKIYDDYAHHPTEIKATLKTAKTINNKKIWVVFQPHTYSRTHTLFDKFVTAFEDAGEVIVLDIYAAREKDTGIVSSRQLATKINEHSRNAVYLSTIPEALSYLKTKMKHGDILLTIGAGDVTNLGRKLGQ